MKSLLYIFSLFFFFFNDTATTEIYTLSLHDALPISLQIKDDLFRSAGSNRIRLSFEDYYPDSAGKKDRKSTRLNSSHGYISYAVFCLKKKKHRQHNTTTSSNSQNTTHICRIRLLQTN